jgi:hypothetical protein
VQGHGTRYCAALIAAATLLGAPGTVAALELLEIDTVRSRGVFTLNARMIIEASPNEVWTIMNDIGRFARIDRAVIISHVVDTDEDGNPIAHQRFCGCVGFLCRRIDKTDVYRQLGAFHVEAFSVEGTSNLESNHQVWQLFETADGRTEMVTRWSMDPDFWVPPLIGTYAVRRSLEYVVPRIGRNIEYFAAIDSGREPTAPVPRPARERCLETGEDEH